MTSEGQSHMRRRKFIGLAVGGAVVLGAGYGLSDRRNLRRADLKPDGGDLLALEPDEAEILYLASLAPSGHNTQPWFISLLGPYHWIIGHDHRRWLPAVDPDQRETLLSLGAFLQNLEYAATALGYACKWTLLARINQDERVMEARLVRLGAKDPRYVENMKLRRTIRSGFSPGPLGPRDLAQLVGDEAEFIHYLPGTGREAGSINRLTIEANRLQAYRDPAQEELADWIRFSSEDGRSHRDGLTTASMGLSGLAAWAVRNFYDRASVLKTDFRDRAIAQVRETVAASAGWILITSRDGSVAALLETGRRMQRLFLQVRALGIGLHPMTQILEEAATRQALTGVLGIGGMVQFILRVGYVADSPPPVSLRRPVAWFLRPESEARVTSGLVPATLPPKGRHDS